MKLILYDFSSNFIPEMWVEKFFSSGEKFGHTGLFVGGHRQIPLITEIRKLGKLAYWSLYIQLLYCISIYNWKKILNIFFLTVTIFISENLLF